MSRPRLTRAVDAVLELRGGDGRTLCGLAAPFNSRAEIFENGARFSETISPGAFQRTIAERGDRVKLLAQHDRRSMPLGRCTLLREDPQGLYMEGRVSQTRAGDEALELIRDGALDGLSIGFEVIAEDFDPRAGTRTLRQLKLHEISVVSFPAYQSAVISGVRAALHIPRAAALARLTTFEW